LRVQTPFCRLLGVTEESSGGNGGSAAAAFKDMCMQLPATSAFANRVVRGLNHWLQANPPPGALPSVCGLIDARGAGSAPAAVLPQEQSQDDRVMLPWSVRLPPAVECYIVPLHDHTGSHVRKASLCGDELTNGLHRVAVIAELLGVWVAGCSFAPCWRALQVCYQPIHATLPGFAFKLQQDDRDDPSGGAGYLSDDGETVVLDDEYNDLD
jgi:hypothetical protein